jgi:DNA-binding CsgD family transcriptional regulator
MHADFQDVAHRLWDEISDFEQTQSGSAVTHLMGALCKRVGAWNATWAGAIRVNDALDGDPLQGWRVASVQALHPVEPHPDETHFKEILEVWDRREIDPSFLLPLKQVGAFRSYSLRRELPRSWFSSEFYKRHYASVGTRDAVFVAFPLNDDCESHFGFYSKTTFQDQHIEELIYALRGIKWFHRQLMLNNGLLLAKELLTPVERKVLRLLLTKASEAEIAHVLDLSKATVHQRVTSIFRKFGVSSRAALMSLWIQSAS